jgi:hypothetical protein
LNRSTAGTLLTRFERISIRAAHADQLLFEAALKCVMKASYQEIDGTRSLKAVDHYEQSAEEKQ